MTDIDAIAGPIPAHFHWTVATYMGYVRPETPAISEDDDYNFILEFPAGQVAGLTERRSSFPITIPGDEQSRPIWSDGTKRRQIEIIESGMKDVGEGFDFASYRWRQHRHGLYQTPVAA